MQVSDLVGQYHNAAGQIQMTGTAGVKKLASSLREMGAGNIFEGTVNSVKGGQVVLGLPNGQTVTARLDGKVSLTVGQSMFFQVKSNDGTQIAIRPFTVDGNSMNLTLMDALKAAKLPVDGRNLSMVNVMMQEQMSIDKDSLAQMARVVQQNPDINVGTLVQMQKLSLPITPEFASQFENYMDDKQAIGKALEDFMQNLPEAMAGKQLSGEEMQQMGTKLLSIVTEGLSEEVMTGEDISGNLTGAGSVAGNPEEMTGNAATMEDVLQMSEDAESVLGQTGTEHMSGELTQTAGLEILYGQNGLSATPYTLGSVLNPDSLQIFSDLLMAFAGTEDSGELSSGAPALRMNDSTVAVLNQIRDMLGNMTTPDTEKMSALFLSKEFKALVQDALEQQWLIRPNELGESDKLSRLYEKLEKQLTRMEDVVKASGQNSSHITQLASDIRSNIDFMNQINHAYTYAQIPLKLSGQNASGELYVYTNKKNLEEGTKDLTAFLHLDMEHLGSTDVSVRMHEREVFTKFYFDNDETYDLVESHISELEARLKAKGYQCSITVVNDGKQVNFVEDFLKKDQPSAGLVHRYSFDMRA